MVDVNPDAVAVPDTDYPAVAYVEGSIAVMILKVF